MNCTWCNGDLSSSPTINLGDPMAPIFFHVTCVDKMTDTISKILNP